MVKPVFPILMHDISVTILNLMLQKSQSFDWSEAYNKTYERNEGFLNYLNINNSYH